MAPEPTRPTKAPQDSVKGAEPRPQQDWGDTVCAQELRGGSQEEAFHAPGGCRTTDVPEKQQGQHRSWGKRCPGKVPV